MWTSILVLFLSLCLHSIAPALSSPIDILDQLESRALNASDADLLKASHRLAARPRLSYTFQISSEPLYLKITHYGNPIDTDLGVQWSYVFNSSLPPEVPTKILPSHNFISHNL